MKLGGSKNLTALMSDFEENVVITESQKWQLDSLVVEIKNNLEELAALKTNKWFGSMAISLGGLLLFGPNSFLLEKLTVNFFLNTFSYKLKLPGLIFGGLFNNEEESIAEQLREKLLQKGNIAKFAKVLSALSSLNADLKNQRKNYSSFSSNVMQAVGATTGLFFSSVNSFFSTSIEPFKDYAELILPTIGGYLGLEAGAQLEERHKPKPH